MCGLHLRALPSSPRSRCVRSHCSRALRCPLTIGVLTWDAGRHPAVQHDERVVLLLDGTVLWDKSYADMLSFLGGTGGPKGGSAIVSLTLPLKEGAAGIDLAQPFHVMEVVVGEALSTRSEFRLELSPVEPFGCSRSAAVPRPDGGTDGVADWYLPAEDAAYGNDEERVFSQNGEDGVLSAMLEELGFTSVLRRVREGQRAGAAALGVYVEIGAGDGTECNTRILREAGWKGLTFDSGHDNQSIYLHKAFVTGDNVNHLIAAHREAAGMRS